jgi:DNA-binding response OmpR family regulator
VTDGEKIPLLIVDDEKAIRLLLARIGERSGFQVDTAVDGLEALEMLRRKEYLIAIVDLMMPRLSGYELLQQISALNPRPTVIVATALTNGDTLSLDDSMVRRVIRKPFDIHRVAEALIETAQQIVAERRSGVEVPEGVITLTPATPEPAVAREPQAVAPDAAAMADPPQPADDADPKSS